MEIVRQTNSGKNIRSYFTSDLNKETYKVSSKQRSSRYCEQDNYIQESVKKLVSLEQRV